MIAIKFRKLEGARFISHIDLLRHMIRTLRRTGINVDYSEGFNPHMLLKLSAPSPLGIGSVAEYIAISCKEIKPEELLGLYNRFCLKGLEGIFAVDVDKNPNFQNMAQYADYLMPCQKNVLDIMDKDSYMIEYSVKGKVQLKDIRPLIKDMSLQEDGILMKLAYGNETLRADRLLYALNKDYNGKGLVSDIIKTCQYTVIDNSLIGFDEVLNKGLI